MQKRFLKILIILFGSVFLMEHTGFAQISGYRLRQADSLFLAKRYTQSMELYRSIFAQHEYTPAMLLKMAYIEEGLNQTGQALYYLDIYQHATHDKLVLEKMEELASKYNLEGYTQSEVNWLLGFYQDHHSEISIAFAVIIIFLASLAFYFRQRKRNPVPSLAVMLLLVAGFAVHVNLGGNLVTGIIGSSQAYLMDGPSPGAAVVSVVDAGHRVEIIGKNDVWVKILWQGKTVYIKENNLLR